MPTTADDTFSLPIKGQYIGGTYTQPSVTFKPRNSEPNDNYLKKLAATNDDWSPKGFPSSLQMIKGSFHPYHDFPIALIDCIVDIWVDLWTSPATHLGGPKFSGSDRPACASGWGLVATTGA